MTNLALQIQLSGIGRLSSDERLCRRAAHGDSHAIAAIYRRYQQALYRYCLAILADPQDAQDALQNTMVKVVRALPHEQREIRLKPWLYRIAHNESVNILRARGGQAQPLSVELQAPGPEPAERAEQRARLGRLLIDLEDLPERQREALLMRELAGLSFAEIGVALQTSPAVARQTLYEARLSLRQMDAGRETSCEAVMRALSDADGRVLRRRDIRAHLRQCEGCRAFGEQIKRRRGDLAAIAPLPVAATLLPGIPVGGEGSTAGGLLGTLGSSAGKAAGGSVALKSAAAVAVVAAVGAGAVERAGLIHVGASGAGGSAGSSSPSPRKAPHDIRARRGERRDPSGVALADVVGPRTAPSPSLGRGVRRPGSGSPGARRTPDVGPAPSQTTDGAPSPLPAAETPSQASAAPPAQPEIGAEGSSGSPGGGQGGAATYPSKPAHSSHPAHPPSPVKSEKESQAPAPEGEADSEAGGTSPPGHERVPPGQGGTPPGQEGAPPGQEVAPPGQSGGNPGHGGTPPGHGSE
jgi:RNA polymerase sigma factor (sigma-70 family)